MASAHNVIFLLIIGIYVIAFRVFIVVNLITISRHQDILFFKDILFGLLLLISLNLRNNSLKGISDFSPISIILEEKL